MITELTGWPSYLASERTAETIDYFAAKADKYDDTDKQPYWVFSDTLLWELLKSLVINDLPKDRPLHLIDAGAGTARWSSRFLSEMPNCHASLIDLSPEMLGVARTKLADMGLLDRAQIYNHDLHNIDGLIDEPADVIISFHNVLSFVSDPNSVIRSLANLLTPGGTLVLVVPNYYHAAYFTLLNYGNRELSRITSRNSVKFTDTVPEMLLFSPTVLTNLAAELGLTNAKVLGFPVCIYPERAETTLHEFSESTARLLADSETWRELLDFELTASLNEEAAARGNNLLLVARRSS